MAKFGGHLERLLAVSASGSGRLVAIAGFRDAEDVPGSSVHVYSLPKLGHARVPADAPVHALTFLSGDLLIAGTRSGRLLAIDASGESPAALFGEEAHTGAVRALAADPLGKRLVSAGDDGAIRVFELAVRDGKPTLGKVFERVISTRPLLAAAIDATGGTVAAAGDDGVIRTLSIADLAQASRAQIREMPAGEGGLTALAFLADGRIAAGAQDGSIRVCFLEGAVDEENRSGENGHAGPARGVLLGPQLFDEADREIPRRLFSAGEDGDIKAWPLDSKRKPRTIELGSTHAILGLAWVPAPSRSKAERRGGTLAAVTRSRRLALIALDGDGEPTDEKEIVESEIERLAGDLEAQSQQVRETAVRALADIPEDEARKLLDRALERDRRPEIRALAAERIGATNRRLSRPALRVALADPHKDVRAAAFNALLAIDRDAPLASVKAGLAAAADHLRLAALEELPALRASSPLVPGLIAERLSDASASVRRAALDALEKIEQQGSVEPIRIAMAKGAEDVRAEALIRLGLLRKVKDPSGKAIVEAALDDESPVVRSTAFLISVAAERQLSKKVRAADPHTHAAIEEIEKRGALSDPEPGAQLDESKLEPLFAALASRRSDTALRGARCLALIGDERATGALLQLSRENDSSVRRYVVEALFSASFALPHDDRLITRLEWLLDDPDAQVRSAAFDALLKRAEPAKDAPAGAGSSKKKLDLAEVALRSSFEDIRVRALQILIQLARSGDAARADALVGDALDDEAAAVRGEAFRTLWAWHTATPRLPLERAARSRHADTRLRVVKELPHQKGDWVRPLMLALAADSSSEVGLAAYEALTKTDADKKKADVHLAAMSSPRPEVRAAGAAGSTATDAASVRSRIVELVKDDHPAVHIAAIEAADKLIPGDEVPFAFAFGSLFYELRVRAGELLGKRREKRAIEPMKELLTIPKTHLSRPSEEIRARAARALADVGDASIIPFYVSLLDDENPIAREMGARGLATACKVGSEGPLVSALAHADLAVRSWAAEGLARLGDTRALPVLAGTQRHEHRPIRAGAILGFVALGPDGVQGILQGLSDPDREIQDLVFAIIVARDIALLRAGVGPDLLLSALSSSHPEIRFAAARTLEARVSGEPTESWAQELVGPRKPEKAADMKSWPPEERRPALMNVLISALASSDPAQRYAAAQVLSLRTQPDSYWREVERLQKPTAASRPWIPHTNFSEEKRQPRKRDWVRRLFGSSAPKQPAGSGAGIGRVLEVLRLAGGPAPKPVPPLGDGESAEIRRLVFGAYAGLIRQAPPPGDADETHRVRRDSIDRLGALGRDHAVGSAVVMPVLRRALSDPHHLARKAAVTALRALYPAGALEPLGLALGSNAADVGRLAVDDLIAAAIAGDEAARKLALSAIDAPSAEVRTYAVGRIGRLFPPGSLEPWLLALASRHADVRLEVLDRLVDSDDPRVQTALGKAMESDHEDLRLRAASALARRGDARTVDVLAGFLRSEDRGVASQAVESLISLAHAESRKTGAPPGASIAAGSASRALAARLSDDPDKTADRTELIRAIGRVKSPAGASALVPLLEASEPEAASFRAEALSALLSIAKDPVRPERRLADGSVIARYQEALALVYLEAGARAPDAEIRRRAASELRAIEDAGAERLLARLLSDREEAVRITSCESLAFRAEQFASATLDPLAAALRLGRRELVLPAAAGLASRRRPEAFQALLLVLKAGEGEERARALLSLGTLGDARALEHVLVFLDSKAELSDEDRALAPAAAESLGRMLPRLEGTEHAAKVRSTIGDLVREAPAPVRMRALTGLRHAADAQSRALIERVASDPHDEHAVRRHAAIELGKLGHVESERTLASLLDDGAIDLRKDALAALHRLFPADPTRVSLLALSSRHGDISQPAASFLARRGEPATLVSRLGEIKDGEVRRRLRQGLVRRGAAPLHEIEGLLRGQEHGPRADAAWLAGAAGTKELAPAVRWAIERSATAYGQALERAFRAKDPAARTLLGDLEAAWRASFWAALRLGAEAKSEARAAVANGDAPASVRQGALRYLASFGDPGDAKTIEPALSDPDAGIRQAAARALAKLAPAKVGDVLLGLAVPDAPAMAAAVDAAVAEVGPKMLASSTGRQLVLPVLVGKKRLDELIAAARAPGKEPARLAAIAALGRIGGAEARVVLEAIHRSASEDAVVRSAAWRALRRLERSARVRWKEGEDQERGGRRGGGGGGTTGGGGDGGDGDGEDGGDDDIEGSGEDDDGGGDEGGGDEDGGDEGGDDDPTDEDNDWSDVDDDDDDDGDGDGDEEDED